MTIQQLNSFRTGPDERGHFGLYGGRFVAETLMPLVLELETAYAAAKRARSGLDFDDLELLARDLLAGAPAVRRAAQRPLGLPPV